MCLVHFLLYGILKLERVSWGTASKSFQGHQAGKGGMVVEVLSLEGEWKRPALVDLAPPWDNVQGWPAPPASVLLQAESVFLNGRGHRSNVPRILTIVLVRDGLGVCLVQPCPAPHYVLASSFNLT